VLKDWEHQEELDMVYPYAFFKDSSGRVHVESENWSMFYHSRQELVDIEFTDFVNKYPDRDTSEWDDWLRMTRSQRQRLKVKWFKKETNNMFSIDFGNCTTANAPAHTHSSSVPVNQEEGKNPMC
jgi:hypothetical protein